MESRQPPAPPPPAQVEAGSPLAALLAENGLEFLRSINRGGWANGDVFLVQQGGRRLVLKTYVERSAPIRWLGRRLLRRERRAYRRLAGVAGVPASVPLPDRGSLLLEFVEGRRISEVLRDGGAEPEPVLASLRRLLSDLHRRGVHHMDLRSRGNLLVDAGRQVWVLDFASAVIVGRRNPLGRLLAALCRGFDRRGLRKWVELAGEGAGTGIARAKRG